MNKADRIFIENITRILKEGSTDKNGKVRPVYKDGTPAYTIYVTQVVEEYDISKAEIPITTFKGDNTRIKTPFKTNLAFQDNDPITFMGWIYIEKYPLSVDYRTGIFGSNEYYTKTNAGGFGYVINEREVRSVLGDSTKTTEVSVSRSILPEKTWHFIATTYDGEKMIIYLNGNKVKSANVESWRSNNLDFLIGHGTQSGWQRTFNGKISEIRIYKRALSAEEIKIIYYKNLNN